jgi:hypothetical protein
MPFDAMIRSRPEPIDELAALGITPVSRNVLDHHVISMLRRSPPLALWREIQIEISDLKVLHRLLTDDLTFWHIAPRSVQRLATQVAQAIPDATFHLGYIYHDPYLMVHYGNRNRACLAIWKTRFRTVAIATFDNPPMASA